jgi:hypothetical protein
MRWWTLRQLDPELGHPAKRAGELGETDAPVEPLVAVLADRTTQSAAGGGRRSIGSTRIGGNRGRPVSN